MGKHNKIKAHKLYEIKDNKLIRKNKLCIRCKSALALRKDESLICGKCNYSEKKSNK
jgi:ribosomal protein S27AE